MARIVLVTKTDKFSRAAQELARALFKADVYISDGLVGDARPTILNEGGDYLISFLSPWIITAEELARFDVAINFHPGSVEYPGSGCYNFALYEGASEYGAVCHHMLPKVDTGKVIAEVRFPIAAAETVETLKLTTMTAMLDMFETIASGIARRATLPAASQHWTRRAFLKREMDALKMCDHSMEADEIARRVRATVYPGYAGPIMRHLDGRVVPFPVPDRAAMA